MRACGGGEGVEQRSDLAVDGPAVRSQKRKGDPFTVAQKKQDAPFHTSLAQLASCPLGPDPPAAPPACASPLFIRQPSWPGTPPPSLALSQISPAA